MNTMKSGVIKRPLGQILETAKGRPSPFDLGREFFERNLRTKPTRDVARHSKKLLRSGKRLRSFQGNSEKALNG